MSGRPKWQHSELANALGGSRTPSGFSREQRVAMLGEVFEALIEGRQPSRAAALFVGGGGAAWLQQGGDLARDFWRVTKPKSHRTPSLIYRSLRAAHRDERQARTTSPASASSSTDEECE